MPFLDRPGLDYCSPSLLVSSCLQRRTYACRTYAQSGLRGSTIRQSSVWQTVLHDGVHQLLTDDDDDNNCLREHVLRGQLLSTLPPSTSLPSKRARVARGLE